MSSPRVWFITGASSGFGYHLTNHVLSQGDIVVTTMRNPSSAKFFFPPSNSESELKYTDSETNKLLVLKLDVTNPVEITDAFRKAKEKYGRIDIVFNNAGVSMLGEFESTPEEKARALFETNFWGASNVTREAVKAFRENSPPGGRLLQNTSSSALTSSPGFSFYSASKAALESISEALSQELDPAWNIKITIIEAGPYNTAMPSSLQIFPPSPSLPYSTNPTIGAHSTRLLISSGEFSKIAGDPIKAVKVLYQIGCKSNGVEEERLSRVPLHPLAIRNAKTKIESISKGVEAFEKELKEVIFGQSG